jgi:two-component system cell cycle sensor histidine kinase/response regulator CckA
MPDRPPRPLAHAMNRGPLRVLNLEADAGDHERIRRQAKATGLDLNIEQASGREEFEAALRKGGFDVILADYFVPGIEGLDALAAAAELAPGVPFIVVSSSIGEERAVACLKLGASDFVHKDRLGPLPDAITAAVKERRDAAAFPAAPAEAADVDERRRAQEELVETQKMELVGKLAGGIAHDFNNLLTIISGYVSMILDRESLQPSSIDALKRVFTASRQATALVRQLLLFSRKRSPKPELVELNAEIEVMCDMLRRLLGEAIVVQFEPAGKSPWVKVDVSMLEQVLMNMGINAREAMPRGGVLNISVGLKAPSPGTANPMGKAGYAFIAIRDMGRGIPAEALPRIFEPFFSTKEGGRGTGLGLATAMDIVKRHDGRIEVETEVGAGTVFRIYLPVAAPEEAAKAQTDAVKKPKVTKGTILLVEDEANVREFAAAVLQQEGYTILQAKSAESALEVWHWHSVRIGLLLTDIVLPGELSGIDLGRALQEERPELKVLLTTGYNRETIAPMAGSRPIQVLSKPYTPRALLLAVNNAFAR